MKTKEYLISNPNRPLRPNPTLLVTTMLAGVTTTITLAELPDYLERERMENVMPRGTEVDGVKTGIFPVLCPQTKAASIALKAHGYPVEVGDGYSFATQAQACAITRAITQLAVRLDELTLDWMVGDAQGATARQLELAMSHGTIKPGPIQQRLESQGGFEDNPF